MSGRLKKSKIEEFNFEATRSIVVTDDWYPCFEDNRVVIALRTLRDGKNFRVRFSAYGADDFAVAMEHRTDSPEYAYSLFKWWKKWIFDRIPDGIDVEWFYEHGFYPD